jgi:hypothetical protein
MRVASLSLALPTVSAFARTFCQQGMIEKICWSEVDFATFYQEAYQSQEEPQWCWAACISMLFSLYGHPVSQARIVSEVYGAPVNMPAMAGIVIAQQLNRKWNDDKGKPFISRVTAAYDFAAQVSTITDQWAIQQLDQGHPIVIGAGAHAVLLAGLKYLPTPMGPQVRAGAAFDPWPGRGARELKLSEITPVHRGGELRFAATVTVS